MSSPGSYKAFVSSTFLDLKDHRAHVIRALRKAGFFVDPMEDWTASADEPKEFSRQRLEGCHLCILLIARRRGHVPSGDTRSITQQEYDEAKRLGIDILPYVLDDSVAEDDWKWEDREPVEAWRADVFEHFGVGTFKKTAKTLDVAAALTRWVTEQGPKTALRLYLEAVKQEHGYIKFVSLPRLEDNADAPIQQLYVEPAVAEQAVSPDVDPGEWPETTPILDTLAEHKRLVLLGDPGSGKSTLTSWLSWQLAEHHETGNEWTERLGKRIPIPMILRDLGIGQGITWETLLEKFARTPLGRLLTLKNLKQQIRDGKGMIVLDGLDEIGSPQVRQELGDAFWMGLTKTDSRWLLTSRIVGYDETRFDLKQHSYGWGLTIAREYKYAKLRFVAPFNNQRVNHFAKNWFVLRETTDHRARTQAEELLKAIRSDDATTKLGRIPNLLTMMALIYRVRARLPHGRALLYSEIAQAYLETIDGWRRLLDRPKTETLQDRRRWLARVGFELQRKRVATGESEGKEVLASGDEVRGWVAAAMAETGSNGSEGDAAEFVDYLARRSGLLLPRGQDQFAFLHLSFQEYFAAVFLQNQVVSPFWQTRGDRVAVGTTQDDIRRYGNETVWRETLVFLVESVAASDQPMWLEPILESLFGESFGGLPAEITDSGEQAGQNLALLLARLAIDPHAGFSANSRQQAIVACCRREVRLMTAWSGKDEWWRHSNAVLRVLAGAEPCVRQMVWPTLKEEVLTQHAPSLYLNGTGMSGLSGLSNLTSLQRLYLNGTGMSDVGGLSGLRSLRYLSLERTEVTDVSGLFGLTSLRELSLRGTGVSDVSGLSSLSSLQVLCLNATGVSGVTDLSGLTSLQSLFLNGTSVSDVSGLSGLSSLQELDLQGTGVSDVSSLASLPTLQRLDLSGTGVNDEQVYAFHRAREKAGVSACHVIH